MSTYQLLPPLASSRLRQSDAVSTNSVDSNSHEAVRHGPNVYPGRQRIHHDPLPSVSQLLTPRSQSSIPASPYSPQQSPDPLELGHNPRSSRPAISGRTPQADSHPYPGTYDIPYSQAQHQEPLKFRPNDYPYQSSTPYHPAPTSYPPLNAPSSRTPYSEQLHQAPGPNPSRKVTPLDSPVQFHRHHPSGYDASPPATSSTTSEREAANTVKPLPRVVGEEVIPGEGPCWVYEDGSTCKKVIDGEVVNAQWGITKAGKPRKRLAIACTTCREKKIKCDPGSSKCVQCEKFGRECKFTTA